MELAPGSIRTFAVGTSYQLGNLASSASSTIEATIGARFPLPPLVNATTREVTKRYQYGKVICIFMGCVYAYVLLLTFLGPENRGANLNVRADEDMHEAVGEAFETVLNEDMSPAGHAGEDMHEKDMASYTERAH